MEAKIDAEAKFKELHELILNACHYQDTKNHGFLICDEEWRVRSHIRQTDNKNISAEEDIFLISSCTLGDFLEEEGQRFAYIFDPEGKRFFLMEISEIIFGHPESKGRISRKHGLPPLQHLEEETAAPIARTRTAEEEMEEEFYGSEGFEEGELDMEGYEIDE